MLSKEEVKIGGGYMLSKEEVKIGGNGHNKLTLKQRLVRYLLRDAHIDELHIGTHSIVIDGDVIKMNPLAADPGAPAEGWLWHLAGASHKPRYHDGTAVKDIGQGATPGPHKTEHQDGGADEISLAALDGEPATLTTHKAATTGVHGVGAGTVAKVGDIAVDANLSAAGQDAITKKHAQNTDADLDATFEATLEKVANKGAASGYAPLGADSKVPDGNSQVPSTHPTATTGVHGVGASTVESVSGSQGKVDTHAALTATHGATGAVVGTTNAQELSGKTLNNAKIKDVDATPVGDVLLKVIDGVLKARNAGDTADANMTVAQMSVGDVLFKNEWKLTEDEELGIVLVSPKGRKFRMIEC